MGVLDFLFLHVPKTGGNYVGATLDGIIYDANHLAFTDENSYTPNTFPPSGAYLTWWFNFERGRTERVTKPNRICITSVRNPFDWLVSCWHVVPNGYGTTDFDYFLSIIAEKDKDWPCKRLIFFPFFSYQGDLLVDYFLHQDSLDQDLQKLCSLFPTLTYTKRERVKVSLNREHQDYRKYYNTMTIDLVSKVWARELKLYGYDFDGRTAGMLETVTPVELNHNLKYFWDTDKLLLYGREIL